MKVNLNSPILFLGLGGAGQRHLRIIRGLLPNNPFFAFRFTQKTPLLNPDFSVNNKSCLESEYQLKILNNLSEISKIKPFLTVVSLPTSMHAEYSLLAHEINSNVLVEKPGFFKDEEIVLLKSKFLNSELKYMVGFQRQYNPILKFLKKILFKSKLGKLNKVLVKVSSFVPSWHPYENYKDLYACKADLGGGILHTECHELFLLCSLFGSYKYCKKNFKTSNKYNIDVPDSCELEIGFERFKLYCDISFMRKPNERILNFEMELGNINVDLNSNRININIKDHPEEEKIFNFSNDYLFELQAKSVLNLDYDNEVTFRNLETLSKIIN